jgi:hypothetical protein
LIQLADITIEYYTPSGDDLDTRVLRANVIKGILEEITTATVNVVNADLLAEQRGLSIKEMSMKAEGNCVLASMAVTIAAPSCKFTGALNKDGHINVAVRLQAMHVGARSICSESCTAAWGLMCCKACFFELIGLYSSEAKRELNCRS